MCFQNSIPIWFRISNLFWTFDVNLKFRFGFLRVVIGTYDLRPAVFIIIIVDFRLCGFLEFLDFRFLARCFLCFTINCEYWKRVDRLEVRNSYNFRITNFNFMFLYASFCELRKSLFFPPIFKPYSISIFKTKFN